MTNDVSRRNFVALAGTGVVLAGCTPKPEAPVRIATDLRFDPLNNLTTGTSPNHGQFPLGKPNNYDFRPEGICVVYMRFEKPNKPDGTQGNPNAGLITIRHAYWPFEANWTKPEPNNLEIAKVDQIIADARRLPANAWKSAGSGNKRREIDFEQFGFKLPHRIYMFVDNSDIEFDNRTLFVDSGSVGDTGLKFNLIRFSEYLAFDRRSTNPLPNHIRYQAADLNYAFWNTRLLTSPRFGIDRLLVVDNYVTKIDPAGGNALVPIDAATESFWYSMNIHLRAKSVDQTGNVTMIPIIIDPDTGNGMGNTP